MRLHIVAAVVLVIVRCTPILGVTVGQALNIHSRQHEQHASEQQQQQYQQQVHRHKQQQQHHHHQVPIYDNPNNPSPNADTNFLETSAPNELDPAAFPVIKNDGSPYVRQDLDIPYQVVPVSNCSGGCAYTNAPPQRMPDMLPVHPEMINDNNDDKDGTGEQADSDQESQDESYKNSHTWEQIPDLPLSTNIADLLNAKAVLMKSLGQLSSTQSSTGIDDSTIWTNKTITSKKMTPGLQNYHNNNNNNNQTSG